MPTAPIVSEDQEVLLIFNGADDVQSGYTGFELSYRSVPGNGIVSEYDLCSRCCNSLPNSSIHDFMLLQETSTEESTEEWTPPTDSTTTPAPTTTTTSTTTTTTSTQAPSTQAPWWLTSTSTQGPDLSLYTGHWSKWAGWSGCTATCGACGKRKRLRACYGGNRQCV